MWPRKKRVPEAPSQVPGSPTGEERRKPEAMELRKRIDTEQKLQVQATLAAARAMTDQTNARIERLRKIARVVRGNP